MAPKKKGKKEKAQIKDKKGQKVQQVFKPKKSSFIKHFK